MRVEFMGPKTDVPVVLLQAEGKRDRELLTAICRTIANGGAIHLQDPTGYEYRRTQFPGTVVEMAEGDRVPNVSIGGDREA